jgi:DNA-binding transcriptional MerR regulator
MICQQKKSISCPSWTDFPDIELYMDQVISVLDRFLGPLTGEERCITSTMINNYVKQKIISPPTNKRYSRSQLAMLFIICIWKQFMQLSDIDLILYNLRKNRSEEEVYLLFARECNAALRLLKKSGQADFPPLEDETENAVRAACVAFAAIRYANGIFLKAKESWELPVDEEEEKKREKKQRKEQEKREKEAKEKEAREKEKSGKD